MLVIICTWKSQRMGTSNLTLMLINWTWGCTTFHNFISMLKKKKKIKSWQVCDWLAKWLIMSGYMDLRRPRVYRRSNVGLVYLWVCPGDKSIPNKVRLSKFGPKMHLSTVKVPIDFGIDWSWSSFSFFNFKPVIFYQILRLLNICVVLYIFSEAIATECSTSHMAPHIYWFLCMRTGSRHGPWNSLPLYLGETIVVQPASPRQLALDFTSCYWFSPCHICFACRNFICQHWSITETTVKKRLSASILFDPQACSSVIFSVVNW